MAFCVWWCDRSANSTASPTPPSSTTPASVPSGVIMSPTAVNGQVPGSRGRSPSQSQQSTEQELQGDEPHITYVELPITVSRAMSPDMHSLSERKDFQFHIPLPTQVVFSVFVNHHHHHHPTDYQRIAFLIGTSQHAGWNLFTNYWPGVPLPFSSSWSCYRFETVPIFDFVRRRYANGNRMEMNTNWRKNVELCCFSMRSLLRWLDDR